MNNQQHGENQGNTGNDGFSKKNVVTSSVDEMKEDFVGQESITFSFEEESQIPKTLQTGQGSIAYELLLLQQRLDAYEQLHIEEMAELREKIEVLRRAFLQETNPQMSIMTPSQNLYKNKDA